VKNIISTKHIALLASHGAIVFNSSSALTSQGMTIGIGDGAGVEVFATITEVNSIDGPGGQANEIDVTDLNSTSKEFILGLQDEGDVSLDINYIPADVQHALLRARKADGVVGNFQLSFTDTPVTTWTFAALVKGFAINNGVDAVTKATVILRISGSITEA